MLVLLLAVAAGAGRVANAADQDGPKRVVLVELYTSQGCDMCPAAEKILGGLAEGNPGIVPIAFHVDYFNEPWKDVFSDAAYSQRQATYNQLYTKPKDPNYGLYYTPMLMIDGELSVNGREPDSARQAIRAALAKKPAVDLDAGLELKEDGLSGSVTIKVASCSARAEKTPLLVCAVLREDGVVTEVPAGENAGKKLVGRFPARETKYKFIELDGKQTSTQKFAFHVDPSWDRKNLRLAVFVQDKKTGIVHQATDLPWRATAEVKPSGAASKPSPTARAKKTRKAP